MCLDRGWHIKCPHGPASDGLRGFEAFTIHVEQRDRGPGEVFEAEDVSQQLLRELDAAGSVEHDLRHQISRWGKRCSAHSSSCAVDGCRVCRIRYSMPMAILARSFCTISADLPLTYTPS